MTTTAFFSESGRFFGLYRMTLRRSRGYMYLLSALIAVFYPLQYALEAFKPLRADANAATHTSGWNQYKTHNRFLSNSQKLSPRRA